LEDRLQNDLYVMCRDPTQLNSQLLVAIHVDRSFSQITYTVLMETLNHAQSTNLSIHVE